MTRLIKKPYLCLAILLMSMPFNGPLGFAQQNYSGTTVNNDSGKPLKLISITDEQGKKMADVFMTGKQMQFDNKQRPIKGGGFIQALPGKYFHIILLVNCTEKTVRKQQRKYIQLGVNRIEWDEQGKTIDIRGVEGVIKTSLEEEFKVVSDLERPVVKDGVLTISVERKGDIPLVIRFEDDGTIPKEHQCKLF